MISFAKKIVKPKYDTLNIIKIQADNLLANYRYLSSLNKETDIFPVLKSNAYGHGLKEVCQILNQSAAKMIVVDSYPEAQIAYRHFKGKVLIIGEMPLKAYSYAKLNRSEFVIYNLETLKYLSRYGKKAKVHLFFNSGMNREGIGNIDFFIKENRKYLEKVDIVGFCSHLAAADEISALNELQINNFFTALKKLQTAGFKPHYIHLGNSAGLFTLKDSRLTAFRPGLAFYGYSPFGTEMPLEIKDKTKALKPALEVFSKLMAIRKVQKGETVSYNGVYKASEENNIGLIPFGYFEGLDCRLSNQGLIKVQSEGNYFYAKIAGRVCMNLSCLDLNRQEVAKNDQVQIISSCKNDKNTIMEISRLCQNSPYENLVKLNSAIRREIIW